MKKKEITEYSEEISGVRLFRDDIESLISRLSDTSSYVEIHDADTVYDNLDELIEHKGIKISEWQISKSLVKHGLETGNLIFTFPPIPLRAKNRG